MAPLVAAAVVSASLVASVAMLVPAMGLLWLYLRRYEGYFDQGRLFFALIIGLFAGILVRALEVYLFPFDNPLLLQGSGPPFTTGTLVYSFAYTTAGLAALETLGKTAVLGFKKFRMRKDTPYYGAALGIGFGAMWTMQVVAARLHVVDGSFSFATVDLLFDTLLVILALGILLAHAASAVWVGRGAGDGKLWHGALQGSLWLAPALAMYWAWLNSPLPLGVIALLALGWGIFAMAMASRRILETVVPPEIRDMVRKEKRREARKGRE